MLRINLNSNLTLNELDTRIEKSYSHLEASESIQKGPVYQQMHLVLFFPRHYKIAHVQKLCPDITKLSFLGKIQF
jgi:hypothetical protein